MAGQYDRPLKLDALAPDEQRRVLQAAEVSRDDATSHRVKMLAAQIRGELVKVHSGVRCNNIIDMVLRDVEVMRREPT